MCNHLENLWGGGGGGGGRVCPFGKGNSIYELAWKSVVRGDLYESPYLAKATPFMEEP